MLNTPMQRVCMLSLVVAVGACFRSRSNQDGGAEDARPDSSSLDTGAIGRCDPIAGFEQCWPECRDFDDCPSGTGCSSVGFLCMPRDGSLDHGDHVGYCRHGDRFLYEGADGCFPYELCRALPRSTRSDRCEYSNGEVFIEGPPAVACPALVDPFSPYCGRECSPCPNTGVEPSWINGRCTGLTEERGVGVCTLRQVCNADSADFLLDNAVFLYETEPVCLVERLDSELSEEGFVLSLATCRAYQALFPSEFACIDPRRGWVDLEEL